MDPTEMVAETLRGVEAWRRRWSFREREEGEERREAVVVGRERGLGDEIEMSLDIVRAAVAAIARERESVCDYRERRKNVGEPAARLDGFLEISGRRRRCEIARDERERESREWMVVFVGLKMCTTIFWGYAMMCSPERIGPNCKSDGNEKVMFGGSIASSIYVLGVSKKSVKL